MEKSTSIKEIAAALAKFQGSVAKIKKDTSNPFFKSKYADLPSILDAIREPMFNNGLSFCQFPTGNHELTTILMHTSGEYLQDTYTMTPTKNDPQGLGSVITYQRRYALGAILGLSTDEDDDGNKASEKAEPKPAAKQEPSSPIKMTDKVWEKCIARMNAGENIIDNIRKVYVLTEEQNQTLKQYEHAPAN